MSDRQEVERALAGARPSSTGWWRVNCPLCIGRTGKPDRKQALAINPKVGAYTCWKCQASGRINVSGLNLDDYAEAAPPPLIEAPEGFMPLAGDTSLTLAPARAYAAKRCPEELWSEVGIGACASGYFAGRVVVPIMAEDDITWLGWVGRTWYPSDRAYTYPRGMNRGEILYRGGVLQDITDEPALIVEGVFDAIHLWPHGVAVLGKASEFQMEAMAAARRPVVVVMDGDAWREGMAMAMRLKLHGCHAGHVRLPPTLDPDEVPRDWLAEEVRRAL